MYSFNLKYDSPKDLSQDKLSVLDQVFQTYINSNPLQYGRSLEVALDRALFKIHEKLQIMLSQTFPEKDIHPLLSALAPTPTPSLQPLRSQFNNLGARILADVCNHGLSPKTVRKETFHELMRMKDSPQQGLIYAFET